MYFDVSLLLSLIRFYSAGQNLHVYRLLTTEQQTLESFCKGTTDYLEPLFAVVSSSMANFYLTPRRTDLKPLSDASNTIHVDDLVCTSCISGVSI